MPFRSLAIARSAMLTQNALVDVAARNVANVETPGYTRQRAVLVSDGNGYGVDIITIQRVRDQYLTDQVLRQGRSLGQETALQEGLTAVESVMNDTTDNGLSSLIGTFFDSFISLSSNPDSQAVRSQVVAAGQDMAQAFSRAYSDLDRVRIDMNQQVRNTVDQVNALFTKVAELNRIIPNALQATPNNELMDQRDAAVADLAGLTGAKVYDNGDGTVDLLIGGVRVVHRATAQQLEAVPVASEPRFCEVQLVGGAPLPDVGGKIGGWLQVRDTAIPSYVAELDTVANAIIQNVNAVHRTGIGLDGTTTGLDFFGAGTGAAGIAVNPTVADDPGLVGASATGSSGDGSVALAISALRDDTTLVSGRYTIEEGYAELVSRIGSDVSAADGRVKVRQTLVDDLQTRRDQVSGVSLDEEAINVTRYQAAFQAAAKVVTVVQQMLDDLMTMLS